MNRNKILVLFIFFLLYSTIGFAQYEYMQINLEIIHSSNKQNNRIRFSIYKEDSSYLISIKKDPIFKADDYKTWLKRDADTVLNIGIKDVNSIIEKILGISTFSMLNGMHSYLLVNCNGPKASIEITTFIDTLEYSICNPYFNTKERNLEQFVAICEEIIRLAKMKPRQIL